MGLLKRDAKLIAQKLDAEIKNGRRHDIVLVRYGGHIVAHYGISRASREKEHNYIPKQLQVSNQEAVSLANCSLDKDMYFDILRDKGVIPSGSV